jgi:lactate dehydrogenase-like 2-hydroxyacid dehydrogenase
MGDIGQNMKKAEVFGIGVIYHNRNKLSKELTAGAEYVSFRNLLANSDIISSTSVSFSSPSCTIDASGNSITNAAVIALDDLMKTETTHNLDTRV